MSTKRKFLKFEKIENIENFNRAERVKNIYFYQKLLALSLRDTVKSCTVYFPIFYQRVSIKVILKRTLVIFSLRRQAQYEHSYPTRVPSTNNKLRISYSELALTRISRRFNKSHYNRPQLSFSLFVYTKLRNFPRQK